MKNKFKKIVELPTGVKTKINDTLEGKIEVECNTSPIFLIQIQNDSRKFKKEIIRNAHHDWSKND